MNLKCPWEWRIATGNVSKQQSLHQLTPLGRHGPPWAASEPAFRSTKSLSVLLGRHFVHDTNRARRNTSRIERRVFMIIYIGRKKHRHTKLRHVKEIYKIGLRKHNVHCFVGSGVSRNYCASCFNAEANHNARQPS